MSEPQASTPLDVLLEDGPVLAVNKPAGLLTQGVPHRSPSLEAQAKDYLKAKYRKPGNVYLGVPHRLDRPVSGVVLFARNSKAARRLAEQFQSREVRKCYWAVVERAPEPPEADLSDWIRKVPDQARAEIATADAAGARECTLHYRTVKELSGGTWLEIELHTGRMHQIRVQLAARGCPILGDALYGSTRRIVGGLALDPRTEPIALHARSLRFLHPVRYEAITVCAPVPAMWQALGIDGAQL